MDVPTCFKREWEELAYNLKVVHEGHMSKEDFITIYLNSIKKNLNKQKT